MDLGLFPRKITLAALLGLGGGGRQQNFLQYSILFDGFNGKSQVS